MNNSISEKMEDNLNLNYAKIPKDIDTSFQFVNKSSKNEDIQGAIILNLFFIIRKKLNEVLINNLYNTTVKLNNMEKEEL